MIKQLAKKVIKTLYNSFLYSYDFIVGLIWKFLPERIHIKYLEDNFHSKHPESNIICVFAHYDKHSFVDEYVFYYLEKLKIDLNATIVFISNSKKLFKEDIDRLRKYCEIIVVRRGRGRDFASYYLGWKLIKNRLTEYDYLIFCNDSVYGPFRTANITLKYIIDYLSCFQFGGITDSLEHRYHIQSYFLFIRKDIFELLNKFWNRYIFLNNKWIVIKKYEIGLSNFLKRRRVKIGAYASYFDLILKSPKKYPHPVNPTHFYWDVLIKDFKVSFLKIELIRDNPSKIENVYEWTKILSTYTDYNIDLIKNHLRRIK